MVCLIILHKMAILGEVFPIQWLFSLSFYPSPAVPRALNNTPLPAAAPGLPGKIRGIFHVDFPRKKPLVFNPMKMGI